MIIVAVAALGTMAFAATSANAAISQQFKQQVLPASGTGTIKANSFVKLNTYLSTRDAAAGRPAGKANPVGQVIMTFPTGSSANWAGTGHPTLCGLASTTDPTILSNSCGSSKVGDGWALMRNVGLNPAIPPNTMSDRPADCASTDATQYSRTYEASNGVSPAVAGGKPSCLPRGVVWVRASAYAATNNRIIFANNSGGIANISFAGTVVGNVLTVNLPTMGGTGSFPGELPLRVVLSDFNLRLGSTTAGLQFLKFGACVGGKATTSTKFTFSKLSSAPTVAAPAPITLTQQANCTA